MTNQKGISHLTKFNKPLYATKQEFCETRPILKKYQVVLRDANMKVVFSGILEASNMDDAVRFARQEVDCKTVAESRLVTKTREVSACCKADFYDDREFCVECLKPADAIEIPIETPVAKWSDGSPVLTDADGIIVLDSDPRAKYIVGAFALSIGFVFALALASMFWK